MHDIKIAVIGAGAVGGIVAAELIEKGNHVDCVEIKKDYITKINRDGLVVDGVFGRRIYSKIKINETLDDQYDLIFLAVKSYDTFTACKQYRANLKEDGVLVSLQNGINNDLISSIIGKNRLVGAAVSFGVINNGPGHLTLKSKNRIFTIGRVNGEIDEKLNSTADILREIGWVEVTNEILKHQWGKLVMNCIINPFCALFDRTFGENLKNKKVRTEMIYILNEAISVGERTGMNFNKIPGKLSFVKYLSINRLKNSLEGGDKKISTIKKIIDVIRYPFERWRVSLVLFIIRRRHGQVKSSMWQDINKGETTEIDFLNGYICKIGQQVGVRTPFNEKITKQIKDLEAGFC